MRTFVGTALALCAVTLALACSRGADNSGYRAPAASPAGQIKPTPQTSNATMPQVSGTPIETGSGLKYIDITPGTGATPQTGQTVQVNYTGWFADTGDKFDSSLDRGTPFAFQIGTGGVIKGWDEGVATMKVGGKRRLIVPPDLAYGVQGNSRIPPNSTLVFDVELLGVR